MAITVTSEQFIKSSPAQVYYALTHASSLHEWLCDFATVSPRPGGRMYLWWHGDFYSAGEYISLEENLTVKFKWFARFETAATEVIFKLTPKTDGTLVTVNHIISDGDDWELRAKGFKTEWDSSLLNLSSVLETGFDRRTFDRPMLGINISDFNPEIAQSLHIPVNQGIRLDEVRQGMGAYSAGLCKDDVIVELDGKPITNDYGSFVAALAGKKGGEKVKVVFYRGPQKTTVIMELSSRPVPDIFWDPKELAGQVRLKYDESLHRLETCFMGVSETRADREPAPGEWSAKQTLAHLIHTERGWISNLDDAVGGYERLADDWGGNLPAHINATVRAYGTVRAMLDELNRLSIEMVAFLSTLPDSFVERKASYFLNAAQMLELESHTISHIDQINAALAASQNAEE
jgi:uncharacterized protein YndB with AHSA1/START domain/uncharacterized damage-inducible protein DinB